MLFPSVFLWTSSHTWHHAYVVKYNSGSKFGRFSKKGHFTNYGHSKHWKRPFSVAIFLHMSLCIAIFCQKAFVRQMAIVRNVRQSLYAYYAIMSGSSVVRESSSSLWNSQVTFRQKKLFSVTPFWWRSATQVFPISNSSSPIQCTLHVWTKSVKIFFTFEVPE